MSDSVGWIAQVVGKCHVAGCTDPKCLMLHLCNGTMCRHKGSKVWLPHDQFDRSCHRRRKCCIQSQVLTKPLVDAKKKEAPDRDGCAHMLNVVYRQFLEDSRKLEEASGINVPDEGMSPPPVCLLPALTRACNDSHTFGRVRSSGCDCYRCLETGAHDRSHNAPK